MKQWQSKMYAFVAGEIPKFIMSHNDLQSVVMNTIGEIMKQEPNSDIIHELKSGASEHSWLKSQDVAESIFSLEQGFALGRMPEGGFLRYDGEGSLFTIAPPGSGKTQCQVIPNLLTYTGSAIVLDVKGECYQSTAGHRQTSFGNVKRFAPDDWDNSAQYNPLERFRSIPAHIRRL